MWAIFEKDPIKKFWLWFQSYEADLFNFERDQERIFDKLSTEMCKIHRDLTFEFGPVQAGTREFIISAGGIKGAFPSVVTLATAAPKLRRWKVTAFRPRRWPLNSIDYAGKHIAAEDIEFSLLDNGKIAGIYLFLPGYVEGDADFGQIGYLMLDEALGEHDVETGVGLIKMFSTATHLEHKRFPLADLPAMFDHLQAKLQGTPQRPA